MGGVAFVFSGQGAQSVGMGKELYARSEAARRIFDAAEALRPGTIDMCFNGPAEALNTTINTQPCLFTLDLACAEAAADAGIRADMCAGFSLGEVAATVFSGMLDFKTGFELVCRRAEFMQRCAEQNPGLMYAVVKLPPKQVEEVCRGIDRAYPVNYNSPQQTVVACAAESEAAFLCAVKEAGGRAIKLKVSGAFHSPFMAEAAEHMAAELANVSFSAARIPLYANINAQPYAAGEEAQTLSRQICSPVRWMQTVQNMYDAGARTFIECGAGTTLAGLIQKTLTDAQDITVQSAETLI